MKDKYKFNKINSANGYVNHSQFNKLFTEDILSILKSGSFSSNKKREMCSHFYEAYSIVSNPTYCASSQKDFKLREQVLSTHRILTNQFNDVLSDSLYDANSYVDSENSSLLNYSLINSTTDLSKSLRLEGFEERAKVTVDKLLKKSIPKANLPNYFLEFKDGSFEVQYFENGEKEFSSLYDFERKFKSLEKPKESFFKSHKKIIGGTLSGLVLGSILIYSLNSADFSRQDSKVNSEQIVSTQRLFSSEDSLLLKNYFADINAEISKLKEVKKDVKNGIKKMTKKQINLSYVKPKKNVAVVNKINTSEEVVEAPSLEVLVSKNKSIGQSEVKPKNVTTTVNSAELVYMALENNGEYTAENSLYGGSKK